MFKAPWRMASTLALLAAVGCGDDDGSGPTGTISVSASPTALTVQQGTSGTVTVTLTRGGGFSAPVTVTVEGLPSGVTASVSPTQLTGTTTSATVTVNVASTVAAGTYPATVRASATGVGAATATYTLTVTAAPDYALSATPAAISVAQGGTGTTTIGIQRTSFTGAVALTLENPPAGITGTFDPASATADQSTLTINVASTVAPGTHNLTVKGSATGPGDKTTTVAVTVTAPSGGFTIATAPTALNIAAGATGNSTVTIVRTNLTTDVALSLVSPPTGITGTFTPATLTGTTLTSNLVLSVAANVTAGTYPVTVRGTAGAITQNTTVNVTVPAAGSTVTLATSPTTLTIEQGSSSTATLTATRTNFTGDITPSVTGNPAGMTVSFNPTPLTANTSTITVNVGSAVPVGQHTLTITGAAGAAGNPTTTLQVSVTAPSGNNIVWEFCNAEAVPIKFWRLSGGTWTEVAPTVVGNTTRFSFSVSGTQAGVAFTRSVTGAMVRASARTSFRQRQTFRDFSRQARFGTLDARARLTNQDVNLTSPYFDTYVLLALSSELASYREVCDAAPTLVSKTFTVSGQGAGEAGLLGYGGATASLEPQTTSYKLMVEAGTYDWMAVFGPTPSLPSLAYDWTHYRIGRGEAAPGATVAINRTGATAFTQVPFTITGGASGSFYTFVQSLEGSRGQITSFPIGGQFGQTAAGNLLFLAPSDRLATDMNWLAAINAELAGNITNVRSTIRYFGSAPPATTSFALPQAVPAFTVTAVTGAPVPTWTVAGQIPTDYQTADGLVEASVQGAGESTLYTINATRGWLIANNMNTSYTLTAPTLPGFLAQWAPAGPLVDAQVLMISSSVATTPVAGSVVSLGARLVESP